jgi:hypothetical protein
MAQIHVSKDPSDKTPVACVYAPLTSYIGSGQEISIMSPEFRKSALMSVPEPETVKSETIKDSKDRVFLLS